MMGRSSHGLCAQGRGSQREGSASLTRVRRSWRRRTRSSPLAPAPPLRSAPPMGERSIFRHIAHVLKGALRSGRFSPSSRRCAMPAPPVSGPIVLACWYSFHARIALPCPPLSSSMTEELPKSIDA